MNKILASLLLGFATATAVAQSPCFDTNYGTAIVQGDDVVSPMQSIGFSFPYNGTTYANFYASTNGFIYLTNGASSTTPGALCCAGVPATALTNLIGPMICPFWTDLNMLATNNANVMVNSTAAVTTITWLNAIEYGDTSNTKFHLQLKLYVSGQIDLTYSTNVTMRTAGDCVVGAFVNGATDPGASDFSVVGTAAVDTTYQVFNNAGLNFDLAGQMVSFLPTAPGFAFVPSSCPVAVPPAYNTSYGQGCISSFNSFYELFATAGAFDLTGTSMTMINIGTGYIAMPGAATYVPPSASATSLALSDDSAVSVSLTTPLPLNGGTTSSLTVCSNGFVSTAAGNTTTYTPDAATFLAMPANVFAGSWHDYNPTLAGSGTVKFEEAGGIAYVTWDAVYSYATTVPDTWQLQFDTATGNVNFVWVTMGTSGNGRLVGYSPGGASQNPGSYDLSVALPGMVTVSNGPELLPLTLAAAGAASPGGTVTLTAGNVPASALFGAALFGLAKFPAGIPLGGMGMPGCFQYNDGAASSLFFPPSSTASFTAPAGTAFLGVNIQAQAAVFAPGTTPLGAITSNGIEMVLGT